LVAKLVIVFGAKNDKSRLVEKALKFPGPMLDLRSSEQPLVEVAAALAAMR
jgi:deoxyxylulose-5-phosphate synthase